MEEKGSPYFALQIFGVLYFALSPVCCGSYIISFVLCNDLQCWIQFLAPKCAEGVLQFKLISTGNIIIIYCWRQGGEMSKRDKEICEYLFSLN